MVPMFEARRRPGSMLAVVVVCLGLVLASAPMAPASAQTSPASTTATTPTTPQTPASTAAAAAAGPTTTVPPWDATPKEKPAPGSAPTPPTPPTAAKAAPVSTAPGFDPVKSTLIESETTPTRGVYANPDGTRTHKISTSPVRFKDGAGKWTDFDLSLVARPDGTLGAKAAPNAATLAKQADGSVATVQTSAGPVTLRHPDASPAAAVVDKQEAKFAKALSGGRDIKVVLTPDGFEESVILPDAKAPAAYREELSLPAGVSVRDANAGVELVDKAGKVIAAYGGGFAYDASYPRGDLPAPVSVRTVAQAGRVATIEVAIADPAWLTAPGRSFPVTIDPVWTQTTAPGTGGRDIQIVSGAGANTNYSGLMANQAGIYQGNLYRSLLYFDTSNLAGATVTYAGVYMYAVYTGFVYSCTAAKPLSLFSLGSTFNETTTWNTRPLPVGAALSTITYARQPYPNGAGTYCPPDWVGLPITSTVQSWVNGTLNHGLELRADESDQNAFQFLWSGDRNDPNAKPFLYVTVEERTPNPPTQVVATPNANGSVGVTWSPPGPNGGSPVTNTVVYALNPDLTYAGSYAFAPAPASTATLTGLDRSRPYIFGVYPTNDNFAHYSFGASAQVTTAAEPLADAGDQPWFSYDTFGLNDRLSAKVNLGTGNLVVSAVDLNVPVVGGTRSLARTYNSLAKDASSALFGYGWRFGEAPDRRLEILYDGSARYWSPSGSAAVFGNGVPNGTPWTLSSPPGLDATLVRNADGTYTLTFHASQEKLTFRSDGLLTADADRYGNTIASAYAPNWPTSITGTAGSTPGNTVNIAYAGPGGKVSTLTQTADSVTRTVGYTYDAAGNLWKVTDARGGVTTFGYDGAHRMTSITGPGVGQVAQVTTIGYDGANRVTSFTRAIPGDTTAVTGYNYATAGHTKVTDPDNHPAVDHTVDSLGRVTATTDPKNPSSPSLVTYGPYNTNNKVQSERSGSGGTTTYDWSANSGESLKTVTDPTGAMTISNFGNTTETLKWAPDWVQDALGNKTAIGYNGTVPDPRTVQNVSSTDWAMNLYNTDGTVSSSTSPNNITTDLLNLSGQDLTKSTRYSYFPTHQLQTVTPPSGTSLGAQSFTYDGAGRLKTATSGKGVVTTFTYDNLDRITNQVFTGGTPSTPPISTGYDANGNMTSRTDASGSTTWFYDAANRLRTKTLPGGAVLGYTYDPAGNMLTSTDAGGTTLYRYNKVNELDQITEPAPSGRTSVFAYDADHRLTDTWAATNSGIAYDASGNNVIAPTGFAMHIRRTYDTAGNLTNIRTTAASSDANASRLADISYAYEVPTGSSCTGVAAGTKTNERQRSTDELTGKTTDYCNDSAGRLTQAITSGGPTYTYGYDKNGNRVTDAAGTHFFNAGDQLTDPGTTYDADGNLTASSAFPNLAYNDINQTTAITPAGQASVPFSYAGGGQAERTSAGTTSAQNGLLGVQAETTAGATTSYVRGPGGMLVERTPGGDFYYYFDGRGSVIGLVDPAGNQRASYTYDPYGANSSATGINGVLPPNPWRWEGGHVDSTGLYHFGARYYEPSLGRFLSVDPVKGASATDYDYANADPVNFDDLDGCAPKPRVDAKCVARCVALECPKGATRCDRLRAIPRYGSAAFVACVVTVCGVIAIKCIARCSRI